MLFIISILSRIDSSSHKLIPNLFSSKPVVIYLCVLAFTFGLIRKAMGAIFCLFSANSFITSISGSDSQLKLKMLFSRAKLISSSVLPTPANAIPSFLKPRFKASLTSFPLTQSAPNPALEIVSKIVGLLLALSA